MAIKSSQLGINHYRVGTDRKFAVYANYLLVKAFLREIFHLKCVRKQHKIILVSHFHKLAIF